MVFSLPGVSSAGTCRFYIDSISVKSTKTNGSTWDDPGTSYEAPDIVFSIGNGWKAYISNTYTPKKNTYTAYWQQSAEWTCAVNSDVYITIYDDDPVSSDDIYKWNGSVQELVDISSFSGLKGESLIAFKYSFTYTP